MRLQKGKGELATGKHDSGSGAGISVFPDVCGGIPVSVFSAGTVYGDGTHADGSGEESGGDGISDGRRDSGFPCFSGAEQPSRGEMPLGQRYIDSDAAGIPSGAAAAGTGLVPSGGNYTEKNGAGLDGLFREKGKRGRTDGSGGVCDGLWYGLSQGTGLPLSACIGTAGELGTYGKSAEQ